MALPALVTLVMAQVEGAAHVREKTYAMWLAENELTRFNILNNKTYFTNFKLPEKDSGKMVMMGMQWQWQVETSKDEHTLYLISSAAVFPVIAQWILFCTVLKKLILTSWVGS